MCQIQFKPCLVGPRFCLIHELQEMVELRAAKICGTLKEIKEVNAGQFSDQRSKVWSRQEIQICWRENGGKLQSHANVLKVHSHPDQI